MFICPAVERNHFFSPQIHLRRCAKEKQTVTVLSFFVCRWFVESNHSLKCFAKHTIFSCNHQLRVSFFCMYRWDSFSPIRRTGPTDWKHLTALPMRVQGGTKNSNSPHKHRHHGDRFALPTTLIQWISPIRRVGGHSQGLAKGGWAEIHINR